MSLGKLAQFAWMLLTTAALFATTGCAATHTRTSKYARTHTFALPPHAAVPESPDLIVERATLIAAPPQRIYALLSDVRAWPKWDPNVTRAEPRARRPLQVGDRFFQNPAGYDVEARVLDAEPGRLLRWRGERPGGGGVVGVHSYRIVPLADGTTLVVNREEFFAWYLRLIGWATDAGISEQFHTTLLALKRAAESDTVP